MVAKANGKLRDATEQLREVLMHRLRSEVRIEAMEKRLARVKENREKHKEGGWQLVRGGERAFVFALYLFTTSYTVYYTTSERFYSVMNKQLSRPSHGVAFRDWTICVSLRS